MASATGYRRGTVCTAPFININSNCVQQGTRYGPEAPWIAYNGTYYVAVVAHTINATLQPPKIYYSSDGLTWTYLGDLSSADATWTNNSFAGPILVASDNNFIIVCRYNATAALFGFAYDLGVFVVDGSAMTLGAVTLLYHGDGTHNPGANDKSPDACFSTDNNLWIAHMDGVTFCSSYTSVTETTLWATLHGDLNPGLDYDNLYSNVQIVPLSDTKIMAFNKAWKFPTEYPTRAFLWSGGVWSTSRTLTTSGTEQSNLYACGDTTNDKVYLISQDIAGTQEAIFSYYEHGVGWTDVSTTWSTDRGYAADTNDYPHTIRMATQAGKLITSCNVEQGLWLNRSGDIWACDLDGANWYLVGRAGAYEEVQGWGTAPTNFRWISLPETLDSNAAIYTLCCGRYGVWFKDYGYRRSFIHTNEGNGYTDSNIRASGPGRHTCIASGKIWFVWEDGSDVKYSYSENGHNWTQATVKTNAANPALFLHSTRSIIYIIYSDTNDNNKVKGKELDASDATLSAEVTISTANELANVRHSIIHDEANDKMWLAIGSDHSTGAGNDGRVWDVDVADFLAGPYNMHDFMASNRRLGRCPEIVALSTGDIIVIDPRVGTGQAEVHACVGAAWTESEDSITYTSNDFGNISAVVDTSDTVHFTSHAIGPTVYYNKRTVGGVYTKNVSMATNFLADGCITYDSAIITYDPVNSIVRIYAIYRNSAFYTPICWTETADAGGSWSGAEMHYMGQDCLTNPNYFMALYVPYWETERYVVKDTCTDPSDTSAEGAAIMFFPRTQAYMRGNKYFRDCKQWTQVGGYPLHRN